MYAPIMYNTILLKLTLLYICYFIFIFLYTALVKSLHLFIAGRNLINCLLIIYLYSSHYCGGFSNQHKEK